MATQTQKKREEEHRRYKRDPLLSPSSSWRENPNPRRESRVVADGCFPGFFHLLFSKFRFTSKSCRSITYGSKMREQRISVSAPTREANIDGSTGDIRPLVLPVDLPDDHALPQSPVETRLNLIGALEKCDRDLETLQKTIDAIKNTLLLHHKLSLPASALQDSKITITGEEPRQQTQNQIQKQRPAQEEAKGDMNKTIITHVGKTNINVNITKINAKRSSLSSRKVSKSMVESVEQVCADVAWGQGREVERIGLALQDHVCKDLIEETVEELLSGFCFRRLYSLPLHACRRRLVF